MKKNIKFKHLTLLVLMTFLSPLTQAAGASVPIENKTIEKHLDRIREYTKKNKDYVEAVEKYLGIESGGGFQGDLSGQLEIKETSKKNNKGTGSPVDDVKDQAIDKVTEGVGDAVSNVTDNIPLVGGKGKGTGASSYVNLKDNKFGNYESKANILTSDEDLMLKKMGDSEDIIKKYYGKTLSVLCQNGSVKTGNENVDAQGDIKTGVMDQINKAINNGINSLKNMFAGGGSGGSDAAANKTPQDRAYYACNAARNMIAYQLKEIFDLTSVLEARNNLLIEYLKSAEYKSEAELMKHIFQVQVMQILIQNDTLRLQAALNAYDTKIKLFKQIQTEAQYEMTYGPKSNGNFQLQKFLVDVPTVSGSVYTGANLGKTFANSGEVDTFIRKVSKEFKLDKWDY